MRPDRLTLCGTELLDVQLEMSGHLIRGIRFRGQPSNHEGTIDASQVREHFMEHPGCSRAHSRLFHYCKIETLVVCSHIEPASWPCEREHCLLQTYCLKIIHVLWLVSCSHIPSLCCTHKWGSTYMSITAEIVGVSESEDFVMRRSKLLPARRLQRGQLFECVAIQLRRRHCSPPGPTDISTEHSVSVVQITNVFPRRVSSPGQHS